MTTIVAPSHSFLAVGKRDSDLFPAPSELTFSQAAEFLRMSERHLNDLLDAGRIPFRWENDERMIHRDGLQEYEQWLEQRHVAADGLFRMFQEMGLSDDYND